MGNPLPLGAPGQHIIFDDIGRMCGGFVKKAPPIVKTGNNTLAQDVVQLSNKAVPGAKLTMKKLIELANKLL